MSSSEKFSLRWNDFESNIRSSIGELRSKEDFVDVTLVCENEQINAHKVIISACSPFFRNILTRNPHKNPLVYLKGVHLSDMQSILDFMYHGEVSVSQDNLNNFLSVAENLEVKGLTQKQSSENKESSKSSSQSRQEQKSPRSVAPPAPKPHDSMCSASSHQSPVGSLVKIEPKTSESSINDPAAVAKYNQEVYDEEEELYDQYDEEIQYSDQAQSLDLSISTGNADDLSQYVIVNPTIKEYTCSLCHTFKAKLPSKVKNHLEAIHFPGMFLYDCDICGQTLKGRNALNIHKSKLHSSRKPSS